MYWVNMKVLVTGAGGFIGKNLVEKLLEQGHDVKSLVYSEKEEEKHFLQELGSETVIGDITDKETLEGISEDVEVVINLAAQRRGWESDENTAKEVNVHGTENILDECIENNVDHFIHCSTSSIIGPVEDEPLDESSEKRDTSRVYYRTKLQGDRKVIDRMDEINATIVLPPLVYGPHDEHHLPLFEAVKEKKIHFVGKGDNLFQPTYIDDCTNGFIMCMKNEDAYGERFIIANDTPRSTKDIIYAIADSADVDINPIHFPRSISWIGYHVLETAGNILGFKPPLTRRVYDWFTENHFFDVSKAKEVLGFQPRYSLEEGIEETVEWYEENGWL